MDAEKVVRNGAFNSSADRPISCYSSVDGPIHRSSQRAISSETL